jgi:pseudouridine-5'-phosphate glycosidase
VDARADTPVEVAAIVRARRELNLVGATLLAVPVPAAAEVSAAVLQRALQESLDEAERRHINGRELTPFLLSGMARESGGATLKANVALLENNARVAASVAQALVLA